MGANERPDNDIQWTRIVELDFVRTRALSARDHQDGLRDDRWLDPDARSRRRRGLHAAALGVDCSPDHRLKEEQYRLWLSDPLALYGVENAKLAPGYQAPKQLKEKIGKNKTNGQDT